MAKRGEPATSSSSSTDSPSSPKRNKTKDDEVFESTITLSQLFDKLNYIDNKMEDHFGSLRTEIASLRFELKSEIEGVKNTIKDMEKSIEAAWDTIGDIQEEIKANSKVRKQLQTDLDSHKAEIVKIRNKQPQLDDYRDEIEDLKARLAEEQEKVTALETYSRRENLRIMNIPEEPDKSCSDIVYDLIQNGLNINVANMHFHAVHGVGKARPATGDGKKATPGPVIVHFLLRGEKDKVMSAKNKLKNSEKYKDVYITNDYARAIQMERKILIKAMFKAKERGLKAKVVNRNLIVENSVYHVDNIPSNLKPS